MALMEQWARGSFQAGSVEETALANMGAMSEVRCLDRLIDLDFEQLNEGLADNE